MLLLLTACSLIGPSRGIHFSHGLSILKPFSSSTCLSSDILVTIFLLLFFSKFIIAQVAQSFPLPPFRATSECGCSTVAQRVSRGRNSTARHLPGTYESSLHEHASVFSFTPSVKHYGKTTLFKRNCRKIIISKIYELSAVQFL